MQAFINWISQPWPWYVSGPIIALVMFSMLIFGKSFGLSANLRTMCSIIGGGKTCEFFDFNWKNQLWNLVFAVGLVLGGVITNFYLTDQPGVDISQKTVASLQEMGIENPGSTYLPPDLFSVEALFSLRGLIMIIGGGFLVGFGTRYAGGCTSGHAISGLSDLQLPSLVAVIGFFIGGLLMTYLFLPFILSL